MEHMNMKTLKKSRSLIGLGLLAASLASGSVYAKASADEVAQLGTKLTPLGAEKGANKDGSIPAWDGGLTKAPACFDGSTYLCDPFADDKPLYEITNANKDQYKDKLTPGLLAMLEKYPTFKIPVYKSQRTFANPQKIYDLTRNNASKTELVTGGNGLANLDAFGIPFPIPKTALEVLWNHLLRYRGDTAWRKAAQVAPQPNGQFSVVVFHDQVAYRAGIKDVGPDEDTNVLFYFKQQVISPARLAGNVLLVHETIDQVKEPRLAWVYNAGQRRVRRAPQVSYDGPGTAADGLRTADNLDMFNGAPDRYEWTLIGKKEMIIPYNNYKIDDTKLKYTDIIKPGHVAPDLTRYEMHRVWVIDAKLKKGTRHIYDRRTMYIDEDSWQATMIDLYDGRGNLWRVQQAYNKQWYTVPTMFYAVEAVYDLTSSRYLVTGLKNEEKDGFIFNTEWSKQEFNPNALRSSGVR
jgi:hypothetical protein